MCWYLKGGGLSVCRLDFQQPSPRVSDQTTCVDNCLTRCWQRIHTKALACCLVNFLVQLYIQFIPLGGFKIRADNSA